MISLTQDSTPVIGQVAWVLGKIMNALFLALDAIGIANIGIAIILFTIVVKVIMIPLTVKQQKYTKLTNVMNPEIQAIQKKYKGKKDQESVMKMNDEQKRVYEKYGTSPTGGCLQIFIQMPILFALYRIIQNIPAYVPSLKALFTNFLGSDGNPGIRSVSTFTETMTNSANNFPKGSYSTLENSIDAMTKFSSANWNKLAELFPNYADTINSNVSQINHMNNFLGVNMSQNPGLVLGLPILIPILAGITQYLSVKLSQNTTMNVDSDNPAAASMKMMTTVMPLMSAVFAISLPAGLGLYWIAQAVVQIFIQIIVNKHIDRIGIDSIIQANVDKQSKKREKKGISSNTISNGAKTYTKNVDKTSEKIESLMKKKEQSDSKVKELMKAKEDYKTGKPGSMAEKAGMVSKFNEKNKK